MDEVTCVHCGVHFDATEDYCPSCYRCKGPCCPLAQDASATPQAPSVPATTNKGLPGHPVPAAEGSATIPTMAWTMGQAIEAVGRLAAAYERTVKERDELAAWKANAVAGRFPESAEPESQGGKA